jgi:hypothetical protein
MGEIPAGLVDAVVLSFGEWCSGSAQGRSALSGGGAGG